MQEQTPCLMLITKTIKACKSATGLSFESNFFVTFFLFLSPVLAALRCIIGEPGYGNSIVQRCTNGDEGINLGKVESGTKHRPNITRGLESPAFSMTYGIDRNVFHLERVRKSHGGELGSKPRKDKIVPDGSGTVCISGIVVGSDHNGYR